jgi:Flp pilus assembly protein TadD
MNTSLENSKYIQLYEKISGIISVGLFFLVPLFFLPTTVEFFEFNKLALLTVATMVLAVLFALRIAAGANFELTRSPIDLPLVALVLVTLLSTVFSLDKTSSIYGSYLRWFPSLFGIVVMTLYFYLATPLFKKISTVKLAIYALLVAATLATLVSILSYYNMYISGAAYFKLNNFSFTGSVTSAVLLAALGFSISALLISKAKLFPVKIALAALAGLNLYYVGLVNIPLGWAVIITAGVTAALLVRFEQSQLNKTVYLVLAGIVFAIVTVLVMPGTRKVLTNSNFPKEVSLGVKDSWIVSVAVLQDFPILATGPSTFHINFPRYRSLNMNNTDYWALGFDKPANELFNSMANMGLLGISVGVLFVLSTIKLVKTSRENQEGSEVMGILGALVAAAGVAFLFTYGTVLNTFLFLGLVSLLIAAGALEGRKELSENIALSLTILNSSPMLAETSVVKKEYYRYIVALPILAIVGYAGYLFSRTYISEFFMRRSFEAAAANNGSAMYEYQQKAITTNPRRGNYHLAYAQTNMLLANTLASKENPSDNEKETIRNLISQAIRSSQAATESVDPLNVAGWTVRGAIYRNLINVAQNAADLAIGAYSTAIQLDPTNARLRLDLGGIYYQKQDYLSAANQFRQAAALKSDYANAHYNFAQALLQLKDVANAKRELEVVMTLVPAESEDYKKVQQELAALPTQGQNVAGAADQKPTVEQIVGNNGQNTQQEPLNNAGEAQKVVPTAPTLPTERQVPVTQETSPSL